VLPPVTPRVGQLSVQKLRLRNVHVSQLMPSFRTGRSAPPAAGFIVFLLCAAVFAWSLQVKLSHYSRAQVHDKVVAKLLKDSRGDNESGAKNSFMLRPSRRSAHLAPVQVEASLNTLPFAVLEVRPLQRPVVASDTAFFAAVLSRPPPRIARKTAS